MVKHWDIALHELNGSDLLLDHLLYHIDEYWGSDNIPAWKGRSSHQVRLHLIQLQGQIDISEQFRSFILIRTCVGPIL